ncbi:MAG: glutaredoxin [Promethearchaeota archaeon CR_4]|nr:MAG: glutaredoxin [Candidatus Lokiarchaeota archaeon CR_4]
MHEDIVNFLEENGKASGHTIKVYALSTCGFCKRALQFLRDNTITFKFVYVDLLHPEIKDKVKNDLVKKYRERLAFPFIVLDEDKENQRVIVGFLQDEFEEILKKV